MINKTTPILVVGAGSIGERHINNLLMLGFEHITVFRQRNLPFRNVDNSKVTIITDWQLVEKSQFVFAIICTPTNQHISQAIACVKLGMHVLVEKPLSHSLEQFEQLRAAVKAHERLVMVAYMMRFHPHLMQVEKMIQDNIYGSLVAIHTNWGSYLPDWHPYEDYTLSYAANKDMGGGAALTLSHDIDVVNRLSGGSLLQYNKHYGYVKQLGINAESIADFHLTYNNGVVAHVHLNYLEHIPRRNYTFIFEEATVVVDYFAATLTITGKESNTVDHLKQFERNDLFIDEINHFISLLDNPDRVNIALAEIDSSATITKLCSDEK